jgi:putative membrane protein
MEWKNIFRGMIMGVSDVVPGVSGGTIAFILGIYDRLIDAISGFFSKDWLHHLRFLLPLVLGVGTSILLFSKVITYFIDNYYQPTQFLFLGLIIGILPMLVKESDLKKSFTKRDYLALAIAFILVASMAFLKESSMAPIETLTVTSAIGLFFAGWIASMTMLLPGVSGSLMLLIMGVYYTALNALHTLNIPIILALVAGGGVGFIVSSKVIKFLMHAYPRLTFAVIIGLVLGSTIVVFPGISSSVFLNVASVFTFILGVIIVQFIGRMNNKMVQKAN